MPNPTPEPEPDRMARKPLGAGRRIVVALIVTAALVVAGRLLLTPDVTLDSASTSTTKQQCAAGHQQHGAAACAPTAAAKAKAEPGPEAAHKGHTAVPNTKKTKTPATTKATTTPTAMATTPPGKDVTLPVPVKPRVVAGAPPQAQYREMHANCAATKKLSDDPIVYPGQAGAAHNHTFIGNLATNADSTAASLRAGGGTSCEDKKDTSAYWFPTLFQNGKAVDPTLVTVYYKSGVKDYRTVQPFPQGFQMIAGDMRTPSKEAFKGNWRCGNVTSDDFPAACPDGSSLVVRYQAPSCWDGVHLDTPDHHSHMAYPVKGVCPPSHPVALPMLESKVPYKLPGGNTGGLSYSSGASFSFHYDFVNGWDQQRLEQLVAHCINGGRQCNGVGYDQHKP